MPVFSETGDVNDLDPFDMADNTQGWDICIDCTETAYSLSPARLRDAEDQIAKLDAGWAAQCAPILNSPHLVTTFASYSDNDAAAIHSRSASQSPVDCDISSSSHPCAQLPPTTFIPRQPRPAPNPGSIVRLEFPISPITQHETLNILSFLCRYADPQGWATGAYSNLLMRGNGNATTANAADQYVPQAPTPLTRPLKILLYSYYGLTGVLALSYLMHTRQFSLPEAYLELQIRKNRSFAVCSSDLRVLRDEMPSWGLASAITSSSISEINALPAPEVLPPVQAAGASSSAGSLPSHMDHNGWLKDPRFDGDFPSRVLPHLYLGDL